MGGTHWVHICLASGAGEKGSEAQEFYIVQATRYFPFPPFSIAPKFETVLMLRILLCTEGNVAGEDMLLVLFSLEESSQINYAMMGELLSLIKCLRALGPPCSGDLVSCTLSYEILGTIVISGNP